MRHQYSGIMVLPPLKFHAGPARFQFFIACEGTRDAREYRPMGIADASAITEACAED